MRSSVIILALILAVTSSAADYVTPVHDDIVEASDISLKSIEVSKLSSSMLTGAIDVTIPVYTIDVGDLKLPVELRYYSNGIKVYEDPGILGYGWTLLPSARIVRTVVGRPDEVSENMITTLSNTTGTQVWNSAYNCLGHKEGLNGDSHPDIFTIALPEKTIRRISDTRSGKIVFIGAADSEYRVEPGLNLDSITVTDPQGNRYIFGGEIMVEKTNKEVIDNIPLAWGLDKIILASGEIIQFKWSNGNPFIVDYNGGIIIKDSCDDSSALLKKMTSDCANADYWNCTTNNIKPLLLQSVTFPNGKLSIKYNGSANNNNLISRITVSNDTDTLKEVNFDYLTDANQGVLLKKVEIKGEGEYSFKYNPQRFIKTKDGKPTYPVDWWGFYNAASNTSLTPPMSIISYSANGMVSETKGIALQNDRNVNEDAIKANLLESIKYPTGGEARFTYELHHFNPFAGDSTGLASSTNTFSKGGGVRLKRVSLHTATNKSASVWKEYSYSDAIVRAIPAPSTFLQIYTGLTTNTRSVSGKIVTARIVDIAPLSDYMRYDFGEIPLWYNQVTEIHSEGKTMYYFTDESTPHNEISVSDNKRYIKNLNRIFSHGPLLCKTEFYKGAEGNYTLIESEETRYWATKDGADLNGVSICREYIQFGNNTGENPDFDNGHYIKTRIGNNDIIGIINSTDPATPYSVHPYSIRRYAERPIRTVRKRYDNNEVLVEIDSFAYASSSTSLPRGLIKKTPTINRQVWFEYPKSGNSSVEEQMIKKNVIGRPVLTKTTELNRTTFTRYEYISTGASNFLPKRILTWHEGATDTIVSPTYSYRNNKITQSIDADGCVTSYYYGYNGQHLVYKVEGKRLDEIPTVGVLVNGSAEHHDLEVDDALITKTLYRPLYGLSSETSSWGAVSRYEYNSHGRKTSFSIDGIGTIETYDQTKDDEGIKITKRRYLSADGTSAKEAEELRDGLGRVIRTWDRSNNQTSIHTRYDNMGRVSAMATVGGKSVPTDPNVWVDFGYEDSPRNIRISETKAGEEWKSKNKSKNIIHRLSGAEEPYLCHYFRSVYNLIQRTGKSEKLRLEMEVVTDEDGLSVIKAYDSDGRMIMRRHGAGSEWVSTYYAYDWYGRLSYILTPDIKPAPYRPSNAEILEKAYIFTYNDKDQLIKEKRPGAGVFEYVYSPAGRLVAERTAAFPAGKWRVIFYDKYGREAIRGIATLTDNDLNLLKSKAYLMSVTDGENLVYNISETPVANKLSPERICLYDSYYFQNKISYQNFIPDSIAGETYLQHPKGLPTMTIDYTTDGKTDLLVNYYDSLGRVRQWRKSRGGLLTSRSISYTYSGAVATEMSSVVEPKRGKQKFMTVRYSYTNSEKVKMAHSIYHGCDTATVRYSYNQGRLSRQNFGKDWQHTALRQLSYDEHSWLKETKTTIPIKRTLIEIDSALVSPRFYSLIGNISDDEFQIESADDYPLNPPSPNVVYTETLYYTDGKNPKYNGTPSGRSLPRRGHYWYSYDNLERLVKADYTPLGKQDDDFSTEYTYDIMSRPLSVKRYGVVDYDGRNEIFGVLDNLSFRYQNGLLSSISSNMSSVEGSNYFGRPGWQGSLDTDGTDVSFNDAGFLLGEIGRDFNSATYSHNSRALRFGASDSPDSPAIEMSYDSQGNLLSRSEIYKYVNVNKTIQRRFADIFTFRNDTLERIDFPGGYFDENGKAHYLLADYLGNVTMQLDADGHLERNISYYPYGEVHRQPAGQQLTLFGGKERVTHILGGSYDYGPRYLDSPLCQWDGPDRRATETPWLASHVFCAANPVKYSDPSGDKIECLTRADAQLLLDEFLSIFSDDEYSEITGLFKRRNKSIIITDWDKWNSYFRFGGASGGYNDGWLLLQIIGNAIMANETMTFEFANNTITNKGLDLIKGTWNSNENGRVLANYFSQYPFSTSNLESMYGGGITLQNNANSTYSIISKRISNEGLKWVSIHELGHAYGLSLGIFGDANNSYAIQVENLARSVMGLPLTDGSSHYGIISNPYQKPRPK